MCGKTNFNGIFQEAYTVVVHVDGVNYIVSMGTYSRPNVSTE